VKRQKPAPDIFLEAAKRIGVDPKFCRAYEDTELGMTAIRAAGMEAVDVREVITKR
jgi:HAD superfamily hydrolase (TIGR01509 family)